MTRDFQEELDREYRRSLRRAEEDRIEQGGGVETSVRSALDHALKALPRDLALLRDMGFTIEPGSFYLGAQLTVFAYKGTNPLDVLKHPLFGRLIREYAQKASKL